MTAHDWLLDVADSSLAGGLAKPVTLAFAGGTAASGTAPCNTYRGAVTLDGDDGVRIEDIATTSMSCEPALMAAERGTSTRWRRYAPPTPGTRTGWSSRRTACGCPSPPSTRVS